VLRRL